MASTLSTLSRLKALSERLVPTLERRTQRATEVLNRASRGLRVDMLSTELGRRRERLDVVSRRLSDRATRQQSERVARLDALDRLRETLGYVETLKRGYAVVRGDGVVVTDKAAAEKAKALEIEFADGRAAISSDPQGSLF